MQEAKYVELVEIIKNEAIIQVLNDQNGNPNIFAITNVERLRNLLVFFNTQRALTDDKQLHISDKCETFLRKIIDQLVKKGCKEESASVNITALLDDFTNRNTGIGQDDLDDALEAGFLGELIVDKGNIITTEVKYSFLKKMYPSIKFMNAINRVNRQKAKEVL